MDHDTEIPSSNLFGWFCIVSGSKSVDVFLSMPGNKVYNVYKASGFYIKHFWGIPSHWVIQYCEKY